MVCSFVGLLWGVSLGVNLLWAVGLGVMGLLGAFSLSWRPAVFVALALSTSSWMALIGAQGGIREPESAVSTGIARLTVEVVRTGCGDGCWSEAVLLVCEPVD